MTKHLANLVTANPMRVAARIAFVYALFGVLWILFSDLGVGRLADPEHRAHWQIIKGWAYVLVTAGLVYYMVRGYATEVASSATRLAVSEQNYRRIVETASEAIAVVDVEGRLLLVNARFAELLGHSIDELIGRRLLEWVADDSRQILSRKLDPRAPESARGCDIKLARKDGKEVWTIAAISPLYEANCYIGSLAMLTDISERKRLESQLAQLQKMEAVGQLAGGVAHDFNNLVTAILGNVDLLRLKLKREKIEPKDLAGEIEQIERAGERAVALTRQLLMFSRRKMVKTERVELCRLLSDMEQMLRRLIREDVQLQVTCAPDLPSVLGDAGQLEQVIVNLVVNARDAMPKGGRVMIEATAADLSAEYVSLHPQAREGRHVVIAVSDTGTGIDTETLSHIFEPFFTTKPAGQGTGLGLATVYGIVKQFGGHVSVYSEVGMGTTMRVFLPVAEGRASVDRPTRRAAPAEGGPETVLICEDDAAIRGLMCRLLEQRGYTALAAESPEAALHLSAQHNAAIDLLITDVVMAGMNGRELAEQLQVARPGLCVLYVSGYTSEVIAHQGLIEAEVEFLEKPFTAEDLARRVRDVLDGAKQC